MGFRTEIGAPEQIVTSPAVCLVTAHRPSTQKPITSCHPDPKHLTHVAARFTTTTSMSRCRSTAPCRPSKRNTRRSSPDPPKTRAFSLTGQMWKNCQAFRARYESFVQHSTPLPPQHSQRYLADFIAGLGILIIGGKEKISPAQTEVLGTPKASLARLFPLPAPATDHRSLITDHCFHRALRNALCFSER